MNEEVREDQADEIVCAKTLWKERVWKIQPTERRLWQLEQKEVGEFTGG